MQYPSVAHQHHIHMYFKELFYYELNTAVGYYLSKNFGICPIRVTSRNFSGKRWHKDQGVRDLGK